MLRKSFTLKLSDNCIINGDIRFPVGKDSLPAVLVLHGFKAFREWGFFPYVCERIASSGAFAISFDFSHNGIADLATGLFDVNRFASNTISKEVKEAGFLIENIINGDLFNGEYPDFNGELSLLGHSLGAAVSILAAQDKKLINKFCLWSSIAKFNRYTPRQVNLWREKGYIEIANSATGQKLRLNSTYIEDILQNYPDNMLADCLGKINAPVFIGHGERDMTVGVDEAHLLASAIKKSNLTFDIIDKAGHTFGISHPFGGAIRQLDDILNKTISFLDLK